MIGYFECIDGIIFQIGDQLEVALHFALSEEDAVCPRRDPRFGGGIVFITSYIVFICRREFYFRFNKVTAKDLLVIPGDVELVILEHDPILFLSAQSVHDVPVPIDPVI